MKYPTRSKLAASLLLSLALAASTQAQNQPAAPSAPAKEKVVTSHASGPFDVKLTPLKDDAADSGFGRMSLDKQFHGDLEGASRGFMLSSAATVVKGSGG